MQVLAVVVLAPIFALAPTQNDASAKQDFEMQVPADFGVAVNQGDNFQFGNRVSSSSVLGAAALLQSAPCFAGSTRGETGGDNLREGYASSPSIIGHPNLPLAEPGVRWKVSYCTVETDVYATSCDAAGNCTTYVAYTLIDHYYNEHWEVAHSQLEAWLTEAVEDAWEKDEHRDKVYWNASPGYNSRQIIGLPTWFAASQLEPGITETEGRFELGPFIGYGGDFDPYTGEKEIRVELNFELPSSVWEFNDGGLECPTAGKLWTEANAQSVINAGGSDPNLCLRAWAETAVANGGVRLDEMKNVQLIYPYRLTTNADKAIGLAGIDLEREGEVGTEELGDSRDLVVGEVQTYGVDTGASLSADLGGDVSPWVGSSLGACDQARGWIIIGPLFGAICDFAVGAYNGTVAVLQLAWDGAQFVGTVVSVILSVVWDLIKGCLGMVTDLVSGVGDIAGSLIDFVENPGEKTEEIIKSLDAIREQLSNPDTALDFAVNVLQELVGEVLVLDLIAERDDSELGWKLKDDPQWAEWIGRMVCEALVLVLTAGGTAAVKLANSSRVLRRIQRWLDGINIPDINPCLLQVITKGAQYAGNILDAYEIANAAIERDAQENNSFPAGTLVLMADGSHIPIEDIDVGDMVMSFDDANQIWEPQPVTDQWSAVDDGQMATLTLGDGSQVEATDGHPFFVVSEDAWIELEDVLAGDLLLTPRGTTEVLSVVEAAPADTLVYELSVAENFNFAVYTGTEDVLVHNRCRNRPNPGGDPDTDTDFRQDDDGNVIYDSEHGPIDDVMLDADGNPVVIKTDDFDVIVHTDGSVTVIDKDGNIMPNGSINPDGSVTVTRDDGSQFIVDADGDTIDLPPSSDAFECNSFPTGTEVRLADGSYEAIENITTRDRVLSYDFATATWVNEAVIAQWSAIDTGSIASVTLSDGSAVSATDHHRFWVESTSSWTELDEIEPGNHLLTPNGTPAVVEVSVSAEHESLVWELTVENTHNFTVRAGDHDLLVHNCQIDYVTDADGNAGTRVTNEDGRTRTTYEDGTVVDSNPIGATTSLETTTYGTNGAYPAGTIVQTRTARGDVITSVQLPDSDQVNVTRIQNGQETRGSFTDNGPDANPRYTPNFESNVTFDDPAVPGDITSLPERPGDSGPTHGVLLDPTTGEAIELQSGAVGPALPPDALGDSLPGSASNNTHVEGHALAVLENSPPNSSMELTINNPPCTGGANCNSMLRNPDNFTNGRTLDVIFPGPDGPLVSTFPDGPFDQPYGG